MIRNKEKSQYLNKWLYRLLWRSYPDVDCLPTGFANVSIRKPSFDEAG